jgi:hypothetical protein
MANDLSQPTSQGLSSTQPRMADYIRRLERRAKYYLISTMAIGATVLALLLFAGYIFFFAQNIEGTSELLGHFQIEERNLQDTAKILQVELAGVAEEEKVGQRTILETLSAMRRQHENGLLLALVQERQRLLVDDGYVNKSGRPEAREELEVQKKSLQSYIDELNKTVKATQDRFAIGEVTRTDVAQAERFFSEAKREIASVDLQLKKAPSASDIKKKVGEVNLAYLLSVNLVRFGGIGVILFLVSILVPVYRYNSRLAAFYMARADALIMCGDKGYDDLAAMAILLTPPYEYEKGPISSVESLSLLIKEGIALVKKT